MFCVQVNGDIFHFLKPSPAVRQIAIALKILMHHSLPPGKQPPNKFLDRKGVNRCLQ